MGLPLTWLTREWDGPPTPGTPEQETSENTRPASTASMGRERFDNQMTLPFRPRWEAAAGLAGLVNRRRRQPRPAQNMRLRDHQPSTIAASPEERIAAVHEILREHDDHLQYLHSNLHDLVSFTTEHEHYVLSDALEALDRTVNEVGLVFSLLQRLDGLPNSSLDSLEIRQELADLEHTVGRMVELPLNSFYDLLEHLQGPPDVPMPESVSRLLYGEQGAAEAGGGPRRRNAIDLSPQMAITFGDAGSSPVLGRPARPRRPSDDAGQTGSEIASGRPQAEHSLLTSTRLEQDFTSLFGSSFPCFGARFYAEAQNTWPSTRENLQLTIAAILVRACDANTEHIYIHLCQRGFYPPERTAEQERRDRLEWVQLADRALHDQSLSRWLEIGFHLALTDAGRAVVRDYRAGDALE